MTEGPIEIALGAPLVLLGLWLLLPGRFDLVYEKMDMSAGLRDGGRVMNAV